MTDATILKKRPNELFTLDELPIGRIVVVGRSQSGREWAVALDPHQDRWEVAIKALVAQMETQ